MTVRRMALAALWIVSLVVTAQWGTAIVQSEQASSPPTPGQGQVVSGSDLGFMVLPGEGEQGRPVGILVIRQRGQWVPVEMGQWVSPSDSRGRIVPLR